MHSFTVSVLLTITPFIASSFGAVLTYHPRSSNNGSSTDSNTAQCASGPQYTSCESNNVENTCCSPTPGGLILQTQFWDTNTGGYESKGQLLPKNSWTIHGLWPDNCDGSFESYCDPNRSYVNDPSPSSINGQTAPPYNGPGVDTFITDFGRNDLLDYMKKYWVSQGSPDASFWAHEFSKHGTCISTFDTKCYDNYQEHQDVVNFFDTVTKAFQKYPTYDWLDSAGITPSNSTTYTLDEIQSALQSKSGAIPYLGCKKMNGKSALTEVWYYSHAVGPVQNLDLTPVDSTTKTKCPSSGIYYYERATKSEASS